MLQQSIFSCASGTYTATQLFAKDPREANDNQFNAYAVPMWWEQLWWEQLWLLCNCMCNCTLLWGESYMPFLSQVRMLRHLTNYLTKRKMSEGRQQGRVKHGSRKPSPSPFLFCSSLGPTNKKAMLQCLTCSV